MFDNVQQQNLADWIKAPLLRIPTPEARQEAMDTLKQFEQSRWVPRYFDQAAKELAPQITIVDNRSLGYSPITLAQAQQNLVQVMKRYLELLTANTLEPKPSEWTEGAR